MEYTLTMDDCISPAQWRRDAAEFSDNNLYQTLAYQDVRAAGSGQGLSRFVIRDDKGKACMMGQVRIKKAKGFGLRIGYVQWGPLCRKTEGIVEDAAMLLALMKEAYVPKVVNVLRINPNIFTHESEGLEEALRSNGFEKLEHIRPYRTMLFPLDTDEDGIMSRFHRGWRRYLRKALKTAELEVYQGSQQQYMKILENLYEQALGRKKFEGLSVSVFDRTQALLEEADKINLVLCDYDGQPVTAHSTSHLGDTGLGILAGSNETALKVNATYLVWWHTFLAAKEAGMQRYDLAGIDPDNNPKVYEFKSRMGAEEAWHIGTYQVYAGKWVKFLWSIAERAYTLIKGR